MKRLATSMHMMSRLILCVMLAFGSSFLLADQSYAEMPDESIAGIEDDQLSSERNETAADSQGSETAADNQQGETARADEPGVESEVSSASIATSFTSLRDLVADPAVGYIELGADVVMTANITIPATKTTLTIDGRGMYVLEQKAAYTFLVNASSGGVYSLQNMTIIGRSYYGVMLCPDGSSGHQIKIHNVIYSGPQMIYNHYGTVAFSGVNSITIQQNGLASNPAQEFAEVHGLSFEGATSIVSESTTDSYFWLFPARVGGITENPLFTVEPDASVSISTDKRRVGRSVFWTEGANADLALTVRSNASLTIDVTGYNPLCLNNDHKLSRLTLEDGAEVEFNVGGGVIVSDAIVVGRDATLRMNYLLQPNGTPATSMPLLRSTKAASADSVFSFDRPRAVVLAVQPTNRAMFEFVAAQTAHILTTDFNSWNSYDLAGASGKPTAMWSANENNTFLIDMSMAQGQDKLTSVSSSNEEFATEFSLANARVIQFGTEPLPLSVATLFVDVPAISGTTAGNSAVYADYEGVDGGMRSYVGAADNAGELTLSVEAGSYDVSTIPTVIAVNDFVAVHKQVTVEDRSDWINVRIPTKMVFGSLDSYGEGQIVSPKYEIENLSDHSVSITLSGLSVDRDEGITLLREEEGTSGAQQMQLGLVIEGVTIVEYLYPFHEEESAMKLTELAPAENKNMTLQGTYFGVYAQNGPLKPAYTLELSFEALRGV